MKLVEIKLKNYRAYRGLNRLPVGDLTALIGRNDVGKSTVLDALGAFFDHPSCRVDPADRNVFADPEDSVEISCVFAEPPDALILDQSANTTLSEEGMLNADGCLEVVYRYKFGARTTRDVFAIAEHPAEACLSDLLLLKNAELKKRAKELGANAKDQRSNVALRAAIRATTASEQTATTEVPLNKEGAKEIWSALQRHLPLFAIFRSDRPSSDEDGEAQDPMREAVKQAIGEVEAQILEIQRKVEDRVVDVANRTLRRVQDLDAQLGSTLKPRFKPDQKWEGLFKMSLVGDDGIPINKRGSGVRRLVLLGFFQAEVERLRNSQEEKPVIYAIEEPETSQHPTNQVAVVEALKELSRDPGVQVFITTHVPALAGLLPIEGVRHITQDVEAKRTIERAGDDILRAIASDLGVLPDYQDRRVKVIVCVEGPTDVDFFFNITPIIRQHDSTLPELGVDPRVAVIPLGGGTLKDWVNKRYLRELGCKEFHLYDRDEDHKYKGFCDEVNARGDGSLARLTTKREIENYLHHDAVNEVCGCSITIDDESDVTAALRAALEGKGKYKRKPLKRLFAEDVAKRMTVERLRERAGLHEIVEWYRDIGDLLQ